MQEATNEADKKRDVRWCTELSCGCTVVCDASITASTKDMVEPVILNFCRWHKPHPRDAAGLWRATSIHSNGQIDYILRVAKVD
jgi:hypothetical protein